MRVTKVNLHVISIQLKRIHLKHWCLQLRETFIYTAHIGVLVPLVQHGVRLRFQA